MQVEDVLEHVGVYDPVARRERYLRDRQLVGRKVGQDQSSGNGPKVVSISSAPSLHSKANQASSEERQIAAFKARLTNLRAQLQRLLAEAGSSSSSSSTSSSSSKSGGSSSPTKPTTAAEKADARKASKKFRDTHQTPKKDAPAKAAQTKEEKIAHLRSVIADVESKLRAALERARTQTASNGR